MMRTRAPRIPDVAPSSVPSFQRRRALGALGAIGAALVHLGCGSSSDDAADVGASGSGGGSGGGSGTGGGGGSGGSTGGSGGSSAGGGGGGGSAGSTACNKNPDETAGPYPDTKGMISDGAYLRSDIREDRTGVPLTLTLTFADAGAACAPRANLNVEIWHCDADGIYSEYANNMNAGSTSSTYLRGVQTTDAGGTVTFQTIYPGWYTPRATHIHIQVFDGTKILKTTQIGFPDSVNDAVYGVTTLYKKGPSPTVNDSDQVWGNKAGMGTDGGGHDYQIAQITGTPSAGYVASIQVAF